MSKTIALLSVALVCLLPGLTASIRAQETPSHPDFTGVYYTFDPTPNAAAPPRHRRLGRRRDAAATRGGDRRACGPAGDRTEAHARVPGQVGGHAEVAHGRIV